MLADVLNAPIAELPMRYDIDAAKYFIDAWTLGRHISETSLPCFIFHSPCLPPSNSQRCSAQPTIQSHQVQPRATSHEELR